MNAEKQILRDLINCHLCTSARPREFFVAWSGVITLAYQGFTPSLLSIKQEIEKTIPGLIPENPGSAWAKTTLGCLKDDKQLSFNSLFKLRKICSRFNQRIQKENISFDVRQLDFVVFQCRSLEKRLITSPISLDVNRYDQSDPERDHIEKIVNPIMSQFHESRLTEYFPYVMRSGNRESHYRDTHIESTLVFDLPMNQPLYIAEFIEEVNHKLFDIYCWFNSESRHITIRSLTST
jgi:hypothetical protein